MASATSPDPTTAHRSPIPPPRHCIIWPSASSRLPAGSPTRATTSAMVSNDGLAASTRPCRRREALAERRFRGGPDRDRGNHLSEVFAPYTGTQRTALGRRRVRALRRSRLRPVPVVRYPRARRVTYPGLPPGRTKEVVDMQMRGGGGMLSDNFSSSCHL